MDLPCHPSLAAAGAGKPAVADQAGLLLLAPLPADGAWTENERRAEQWSRLPAAGGDDPIAMEVDIASWLGRRSGTAPHRAADEVKLSIGGGRGAARWLRPSGKRGGGGEWWWAVESGRMARSGRLRDGGVCVVVAAAAGDAGGGSGDSRHSETAGRGIALTFECCRVVD